jgi:acyl-coenzyme A synthetase/AMP-(fatty) acid ligase
MKRYGGYATALKFSMKNIYGLNEGSFWAASDIGWVVGHSLSFMVHFSIEILLLFTKENQL